MESFGPSTAQVGGYDLHGAKWSPPEKIIARKVFDEALKQELGDYARGEGEG